MKKSKSLFSLIALLLFLLFPFSLFAQSQPFSLPTLTEEQQKGLYGRDLIFHRQYDQALEHFKKLEVDYPDSSLGTFGQMAIWQARMFENYDFKFDSEFDAISQKNKIQVGKILKQSNASAWDLFLAGSASGLRGFYDMRKDAVFRALSEANTAKKAMNLALQKDPSFADVYLGLGMYDYWRSVFTNRIKILPFFSDKRNEGLAQIERAQKEGRVAGALADTSLAFCYLEGRQWQKAIPILEKNLKDYPENVISKNLLVDFYGMQKNYVQAHKVLDDLLKNNPDIFVAQFFKGKTYLREGKRVEARRFYEQYLKTQPNNAWTAYALTDLGLIDLQEGKENEAYEKFKTAYRTYPDYHFPLKQLQKLRK